MAREQPIIGEDPLVLKQRLLEYGEKWLALANNRFRDYDLENRNGHSSRA